jgi:O-antigen/teichoic acid export membrane protein
MGIALIMLKWLEYFTESGVNDALIQKRGDVRPYLNTAWTVQALRSVGLSLALFFGAPVGAWFFNNHEATSVIRAVALITLLRGLTNPAVIYLRKELEFHKELAWRVSGVTTGVVVGIALALAYRNVWALVLSVIATQVTETVLSYWIVPYRPRPHLDWGKARELFRFGKWIFWMNVIDFLGLYVDSVAIGRMLGATALGYYQTASSVALLATSKIGNPVRGVMFPAFSKLQGTENLRRALLKTLALVFSVAVPLGCFLTVFAEPVVLILLGERWAPIVPAVQILTWAGVAKALKGITGSFFKAVGRPSLTTTASLLRAVLLLVLFYPLIRSFGMTGAAVAFTSATVAATLYQWVVAIRMLRPAGRELAATFKVGVLGSAPFLGAGVLVSPHISISLFVAAGVAIAIYLIILVRALRSYVGQISLSQPSRP